jgi:hypothetical protein
VSETKIKSRCAEVRHLKNGAEIRGFDCTISKHIDSVNIYIPEIKRTISVLIKDIKEILDAEE